MPPKDSYESSDHEREKIERLRRAMYSRSISPNIKDRPRRELEPESSPVGDDWVRPEPKMASSIIAPRGMGAMRVALRFLVGTAMAFFIGAAGFFAYYFLIGGGSAPVSPGNIDISVSGPLQVTSGAPVQLQIAIVNRNRTSLQLADLVVKFPQGTRSSADFSTDLPFIRQSLGTIEPGGRRQGTVSAILSGNEGKVGTTTVELEYRLQGSSAIFVAATEYQFLFASSPLSIAIEGNDEIISGQPVELAITVTSNADAPVKDVLLSASYPFGYTFTLADPEPLQGGGGNMWSLGDFTPGQKRTVTLRGVLLGESGDERVFRFTAGTRKERTDQSISTTLADYAHQVTVSRPFLGLAVTTNRESSGGVVSVTPGESVTVSVAWQNNLSTPIADAVIVARLSGVEIDGSTVRSSDGFYRSTDKSVLWDKSTTNGVLGALPPGARGTVSFSFPVPSGEATQELRDPRLNITVHAAGRRVAESGVPETLQASASQTLRFASALDIVAQGLYYSNPFGSTGPMPPKAESETTYAAVFNITNTTSRITNAVVKATLPPYVRWIGIYSPSNEKLLFNPNDSSVTWQVGTIEPGAGVGQTLPRHAAIAIGFTPSTSQIGQQPILLRDITLTGIDESSGKPVSKKASNITTSIMGDPGFSASAATVVK